MTLTIELTPEEARRVEEARRRGVGVDALLRRAIAQMPETETPTVGQEILAELERAGVIGSRPDITDSQAHARTLREQAQRRERAS
ncbi:MAG TPA: hypothetical protein VKU00_01805 [Chthonomonadaceae bacterium]|nr:hypothetical protein [Chthonomonadaceae bacterium]